MLFPSIFLYLLCFLNGFFRNNFFWSVVKLQHNDVCIYGHSTMIYGS